MASCRAMKHPTSRALGVTALLWVTACGGETKPAEVKKTEAPVAEVKAEAPNKFKAEREAKAKAAEEAAANKIKQVDALTVLPAKLPKKLTAACEELNTAMDAFMLKWFPANWPMQKTKQLNDMKESCTKGNIETAACQANALAAAPEELNKAVPDLLGACIEKFGKK